MWGGHFWSGSYFAGSCGGAPLAVVNQHTRASNDPSNRSAATLCEPNGVGMRFTPPRSPEHCARLEVEVQRA
ncbi:hypothetical protein [Hoyosella sp. YIM 151337]|uniref:hypothetical protein n=1 Tax=Hoyosella sp. YIM 151337 TaxID=2992742 RepID=UPI0035A8937D